MEEKIYRKIELENGHTLSILDESRKISKDACLVKMKAVMEFDIHENLFTCPLPNEINLAGIKSVLGDKIVYEYVTERNFIMNHEKEGLFKALVDTFMNNLGQYVANPRFPEKFILKEYKDRKK